MTQLEQETWTRTRTMDSDNSITIIRRGHWTWTGTRTSCNNWNGIPIYVRRRLCTTVPALHAHRNKQDDNRKEHLMEFEERDVIIEIQLSDGWMSMYAGRMVGRNSAEIVLENPCFVKDTGRRHLFFAGTPDKNAEWEPSGPRAYFPRVGTIVTDWPHGLEMFAVAR